MNKPITPARVVHKGDALPEWPFPTGPKPENPMSHPPGTPRGIRNNNPGNIDRNATKWQGMSADQSSDSRFVVFDSPEYGIRAMVKVLQTYQSKHGLKSVRQMIDRWAPPVENNTGAYIAAVARSMGVREDEAVNLNDIPKLTALLQAIIQHENGVQPYSTRLIHEAIRLAGIA